MIFYCEELDALVLERDRMWIEDEEFLHGFGTKYITDHTWVLIGHL